MGGDLACEDRVLGTHALLDEGVADAVHQRDAAGVLDRLGHGPTRADVVDDLLAGGPLEDSLSHECRREVPWHELTRVVDEETAVGVTVIGDADVGGLLLHLANDELAILGEKRVRLVVREAPVRVEVTAHDVELRQLLEYRREHRAGHPVRGVDDHSERPDRLHVDEREHLGDEARPDVLLAHRPARSLRLEVALRERPDLSQP
jgi:hypothetical protein